MAITISFEVDTAVPCSEMQEILATCVKAMGYA
jgi:hypothetical protein